MLECGMFLPGLEQGMNLSVQFAEARQPRSTSRGHAFGLGEEMQTTVEPQSLVGASLQELVREMLVLLSEDPERDGLLDTPGRMERSMQCLTKGYQENPEETLLGAMFDVAYDEMVIVKDIKMFSLCEHHFLPFFGKVHVAYIPQGEVIGLSKVPRLVSRAGAAHNTNR
jgi:GTP cyclohydrolase I